LLHKILPTLVLPVGVVLILLVVALVTKKRRWVVAAMAVLLLFSNPFIARKLAILSEVGQVRLPVESMAEADAIVVLSGGRVQAPGTGESEWNDADRYFGGVELVQAGRAPKLVFTGAFAGGPLSEGEILRAYAMSAGVPDSAIAVTGFVANTEDEATAVRGALGVERGRIILVTSAFHMPRSKLLFERVGFVVEPFPVDFTSRRPLSVRDVFPTADALEKSERALREYIGRGYYTVLRR
jgi:uncharacterized SAM-binding protein YcdF (DUF218 family)